MNALDSPVIARISQEQLDYLIGSTGAEKDIRRLLRNSVPIFQSFTSAGAGTQQVLNADVTRIALYVACTNGNVSFSTNPNVAAGDSVTVYPTTSLGMIINWREYGYKITDPWFAAFLAANVKVSFIQISCPGFWDV